MYFTDGKSKAFGWDIIYRNDGGKQMKRPVFVMSSYYIAMLLLNLLSLILFRNSIHVAYMSLIPLSLLGDSIFQAYYYANHEAKDFKTTYSAKSNITDHEWEQLTRDMINSHLIAIPLYVPFIFFFTWGKMLSFVLFVAAFLGGSIRFRIRHGKEMQERYRQEKRELNEQQKKEEMGRWK